MFIKRLVDQLKDLHLNMIQYTCISYGVEINHVT
jgi:hypothetical protein